MVDIEELTASLVREYLSRKGLKNTLKILDTELPRTDSSISNRAQLAKEVHIERLMKKNKEVDQESFRTMLEVIINYMRDRDQHGSSDVPQSRRPGLSQALERKKSKDKILDQEQDPHSSKSENKDINYEGDIPWMKTKDVNTSLSSSRHKTNLTHVLNEENNLKSDLKKKHVKSKTEPGLIRASNSPVLKPTEDVDIGYSRTKTEELLSDTNSRTSKPGRRGRHGLSNSLNSSVMSSGLGDLREGRGRPRGKPKASLEIKRTSLFPDEDVKTEIKEPDASLMIPSRGKGSPEIDIETDKKLGGQNTRTAMDQLFDSTKSELSFLKPARTATKSKSNEMVFEDIDDDFAAELSNLTLGGPPKPISADFTSKAITLDIAMGLKNLIFGQANSCFNPEWRKQGFGFKDFPGLEYGIVQHKGGSCGILASVQAIVLKHLILKKNTGGDLRSLQVSSLERTNALSSCLSEILWRCGDNKTATVALPSMGSKFMGGARYKTDGLTESLTIYSFKTEESLLSFARQNISQFENGSGVVLLLYSAIFSRTITGIKSDMDEPSGKLLGAHGYCTQEMVNLLLTGKAHSNVFDNIVELDSNMKLRGLEKHSDIGLLSLFEHYGSCEVGSFYKTPKFPIWVVCSESHFSVLFSTNRNLLGDRRLERKFDLFYYDGLARQEEEIRLTVDTTRDPEYSEGDLVPPLELCIRTKWNSAYVDWNGSEPIL